MSDHNAQFDITAKSDSMLEAVEIYSQYVAKHGLNSAGGEHRKSILKQTFWHAIEAAYLAGVNDGISFKKTLTT